MSYGSKTDSEGNALRAEGNIPVITGERVEGNEFVSLEMAKDKDGNLMENRSVLTIKQSNGASFRVMFFDSEEDWAIKGTNEAMLHICTRIMSEEEYYAAIAGSSSFQAFMTAIGTKVIPQAAGKKYTMKIILKHNKSADAWFPNFPKFPNYVELDGTNPTTIGKTNPKYDIYAVPPKTDMATTPVAASSDGGELF